MLAGLLRLVLLSGAVEFGFIETVVVVVILLVAGNAVKSYLFGVQHWSQHLLNVGSALRLLHMANLINAKPFESIVEHAKLVFEIAFHDHGLSVTGDL